MPTVLTMYGWRFFFFANEGSEPIHIHCRKGDADAKYWLNTDSFEAEEAYAYNMSNAEKRLVREIIFEHFNYLVEQWNEFDAGR